MLNDFQVHASQFNCTRIIWGGDFNTALSVLDSSNVRDTYKGTEIEKWSELNELSDAYRTFWPESKRYTFFAKKSAARLDYFLVSLDVMNVISDVSIGTSYKTDHAPIFMEFSTGRNPKGNNYWKFSNYLLHCNEYTDQLRAHIPLLHKRYAPDSNPHLIFDMVKVGIQQFTRSYIKNKNKCKKNCIEELEAKIAHISCKIEHSRDEVRAELITEKEKLQTQLDVDHKSKWREYFIGRMLKCNETSSKYFFKKVSCIPGAITMLYDREGEEQRSDSGILHVCEDFYTNLYRDDEIMDRDSEETISFNDSKQEWSFNDSASTIAYENTENNFNWLNSDAPYAFIPDNSSLRVSKEDSDFLARPISLDELRDAIKGMHKGKACGSDGLMVEFYEFFFEEIKFMMYDSLNYSFLQGEMSCTQKRGILKLIPKRNRNPNFVSNNRPITLLSVDVKIVSRALAVRLQGIISKIIPSEQKGFILNRQMGDNVIDVYSIIAAAEENNEHDILMFLDIEKAYDTVKWRFISSVRRD